MEKDKNSRALISFDWAIKKNLRDKANFEILEGFLSELIKLDIKIESLLESETNKQHENDKYDRVDILARTTLGELILIEIQYDYERDYFHRMVYGISKLISEYISSGELYGAIKKAYSVNIVYFELGQGTDYVYEYQGEFKGIHNQDILAPSNAQKRAYNIKTVADIFPKYYLIKVGSFDKEEPKDGVDEWLYFLKKNEIKDHFSAKGIEKAKQNLKVENMDKEEKQAYQRHIENRRIEKSVMESAEYLAKMQTEVEIIKSMLVDGLSVDFILKYVKILIREDIEKIARGEEFKIS